VLFALGHTIGFRRVDPSWNADGVVNGMRSLSFHVMGFNRSYWDFFSGFGFFVSVFLVFAAILAWQFGSLSREALAAIPVARWSFAACFVLIAGLTWRYFFLAPGVFSTWWRWDLSALRGSAADEILRSRLHSRLFPAHLTCRSSPGSFERPGVPLYLFFDLELDES